MLRTLKSFGFTILCLFWISGAAASPCPETEAHQFDFWIGEWDVVNKFIQDDGSWKVIGKATNRVYPVLDGCAIIEHWEGNLGSSPLYGFSIRAFNPKTQQWDLLLNWPSPNRPTFGMLKGTFSHGRGEFFSKRPGADGKEMHIRYSFADISENAFRWDAARSEDGRNWFTHWIMEFTRRPADSLPLFNGPTTLSPQWQLCRGEEHRQFDFLIGRWQGTLSREGQETPVQTHALPLLQGCAVMDFTEWQEEPEPRYIFRIRAYDPSSKQWVLYRIDSEKRVFESLRGGLKEGRMELTGRLGGENGESDWKVVWSGMEEKAPVHEVFRSEDGGASWQPVSKTTLKKGL